jgi:hypothetical protein
MRVSPWLVIAAIAGAAGAARADGKYHAVPGGTLQLRVLKYDGEVNGKLAVEVHNGSKRAVSFSARGLYFVPDGDPDRAPQRLGAVGPMEIGEDREDEVRVPAGGTVEVTLDVFCVDDHRDAPTSETAFTLARHRMPAALARAIDRDTRAAAKAAGGFGNAESVEPVQSEVWKARDSKWVKLDGEGAQETEKASGRDHERIRERERDHDELK